jgi:hypothetical protein
LSLPYSSLAITLSRSSPTLTLRIFEINPLPLATSSRTVLLLVAYPLTTGVTTASSGPPRKAFQHQGRCRTIHRGCWRGSGRQI